eukprot:Sspe_Gene.10583::Locus_3543_Transcript_1_1_Confidence_1.000_Length_3044::g.10583::m.10583
MEDKKGSKKPQLITEWTKGELKKLGGVGGRQNQTRWFELRGRRLYYYGEPPKGYIDLRCVDIVDEGKTSWTITGSHLRHPYTLASDTEEDKERWLKKIRDSMASPLPGFTEDRLEALENEREALLATADHVGMELRRARELLTESEENRRKDQMQCAALTKEVQALTEQVDGLRSELSASTAANGSLAEQLKKKEEDRKAAEEEIAAVRSDLADRTRNAKDLQGSLDEARAEIAALRSQLDEVMQQVDDRDAQVVKATHLVEAKTGEVAALTSEVESLREALSKATAQAAEEAANHSAAVAARTEAERERDSMQERLEAISAECDDYRQRLEHLSAEASTQISAQTETLREAQQVAEKEMERYQRMATEAHEELQLAVEQAKRDVARVTGERDSLQQLLARTKRQLVVNEGHDSPHKEVDLYTVVGSSGAIVRSSVELTSEKIGHLPCGAALEVTEVTGNRARAVIPVEGWVSVRSENGTTLLEKAQPLSEDPPQFVGCPGSPCSVGVVRNRLVAGWVPGKVLRRDTDSCLVEIYETDVAISHGVGGTSNVPFSRLQHREPRWVTMETFFHRHPPVDQGKKSALQGFLKTLNRNKDKEDEEADVFYQVDFGSIECFNGVGIPSDAKSGIAQFSMQASADGEVWMAVDDGMIFCINNTVENAQESPPSPTASTTVNFKAPVTAQQLRLIPKAWHAGALQSAAISVSLLVDKHAVLHREGGLPQEARAQLLSTLTSIHHWKNDVAHEEEIAALAQREKAIDEKQMELSRDWKKFEAEKREFEQARTELIKMNAALVQDIHLLKEKGQYVTQKTLSIQKGSIHQLDGMEFQGTTIVAVKQLLPADRAGVEPGMRITRVNSQTVETEKEVLQAIREAGLAFEITVEKDIHAPLVDSILKEKAALKAEVDRQWEQIHSLEAKLEKARRGSVMEEVRSRGASSFLPWVAKNPPPSCTSPTNEVVL